MACSPTSATRLTSRSGRIGRGLKGALACATAAAVALTAGCTTTSHASDGEVVIRIGDSFAATHPIGRSGTKDFLQILRDEGPGAGLDIEYFASGQLGKQRDMPAILRTGVAQIAAVSPAYVGTQLPLANVGDLPGMTDDPCVGGDAMLEIMQPGTTLFEEELKPNDVHPLWVAYIPSYEAMSGSFPVRTPQDLDGKIMRSTGGAADRVIDAAGGAGVSMPLGDMYEAISRGTVQGTLASPLSVTPYKLQEVLSYSTEGAQLGSFTVTYSISDKVWNELNDDQKAVVREASDTAQESVCKEIRTSMDKSKQAMRDSGVDMHLVTPDERPMWDALAAPVRESWVNDLESTGRPAAKVLSDLEAALATARQKHGVAPND